MKGQSLPWQGNMAPGVSGQPGDYRKQRNNISLTHGKQKENSENKAEIWNLKAHLSNHTSYTSSSKALLPKSSMPPQTAPPTGHLVANTLASQGYHSFKPPHTWRAVGAESIQEAGLPVSQVSHLTGNCPLHLPSSLMLQGHCFVRWRIQAPLHHLEAAISQKHTQTDQPVDCNPMSAGLVPHS